MNNKLAKISFSLLCSLLLFAPLARGGVQGWAVIIIQMLTTAAVALLLLRKCLEWDWKRIRTPLDIPILLLLVLTSLSTLNSSLPTYSFNALLVLGNYLAVYYLVIYCVGNFRTKYGFAWFLVCLGGGLALFGLIKFSGIPIFSRFEYVDLPDFGALTATYGNPNHMAGFFAMLLPLTLGLVLADDRARQNTRYYVPMILLCGTALILTLSRGGWTCAMLGLVFFIAVLAGSGEFPRRRTVIAMSGSAIVLILVLLSSFPAVQELLTIRAVMDKAGGLDSRLQVTKAVGLMIADRPLLGFGPGTFAYTFFKYQPAGIQGWYNMAHNDYAHFTAELGILFPLVMIWAGIALFRQGFMKLYSPSLFSRSISLGCMAGIVAMLFHSLVDFNLHIPANALLFTVFCALVAAPEMTETDAG